MNDIERSPRPEPLWLQLRNHPSLFCLHPTPKQLATMLECIASEVERRDIGETAEWLRAEADRAERGETVDPSEADCLTRLRQTHCISNTMSKTDPIQLRKEIHERIELSVYGPGGREQETAADSWELAGVLTAALMRIEDLERRLDAARAERGETINPSEND